METQEERLARLEGRVYTLTKRVNNHEPIVKTYGERNIRFALIGLITIVNLLLLLLIISDGKT